MRGGATAAEMKEWLKIRRRRPGEVHPLDTGVCLAKPRLTTSGAAQRGEQNPGFLTGLAPEMNVEISGDRE